MELQIQLMVLDLLWHVVRMYTMLRVALDWMTVVREKKTVFQGWYDALVALLIL